MTIQYSVAVMNAQLQTIETVIEGGVGFFPYLVIFSGSAPATAGAAETGTRLLVMPLPTDFFTTPSGGVMSKTGNWQATATASGTAGYFRIQEDSPSTTADLQGSVGTSSADLIVDSTAFVSGQIFTVITFTVTHNQG